MIKYASPLNDLPLNWLECIGNNVSSCKKRFPASEIRYRCTCETGELLDVKIDTGYLKTVSPKKWKDVLTTRARNIYRPGGKNIGIFQEFLPVNDIESIVSLSEGWTPIDPIENVAAEIGVDELYVKSLGMNPTGSFKDYGMAMLMTHANWLYKNGILKNKVVACASTGNTSSSLAAYAAKAGFKCYIFVGNNVSDAKIFQTKFYGPEVIQIDGSFDDAMLMVDELSEKGHFYLGNSKNPYRIEGQKAIIMETLVQRDFDTNFVSVLPVGNAGNVAAMTKALLEWQNIGIIKELPRVYGVQAAGASPLARKFETGIFEIVKEPKTDASAIKIGNPVSGEKAERGIKATGGKVIAVEDPDIYLWQRKLAVSDGIGCEPASAASVAGLYQLVANGDIDPNEEVICFLTGNLLKDTDSPRDYNPDIGVMPKVPPDEKKILKVLGLN